MDLLERVQQNKAETYVRAVPSLPVAQHYVLSGCSSAASPACSSSSGVGCSMTCLEPSWALGCLGSMCLVCSSSGLCTYPWADLPIEVAHILKKAPFGLA